MMGSRRGNGVEMAFFIPPFTKGGAGGLLGSIDN